MGVVALSATDAVGRGLNAGTAVRSTGIVVALATEAATIAARSVKPGAAELADGALLWLGGMGPAAAQYAAEQLADADCAALAVFGVAGALSPHLRNGMLYCPERVLDGNGREYVADAAWRRHLQQLLGPSLHTEGTLLGSASPLLTAAAKTAAHGRFGALAVDMESAAVAAVAHQRGLPFVVLRAIVDEVDDAIPVALNDSVDAWGRPRPLHLVGALARHPSLLGELPRLYSRMQRATRALRTAASAAGPALGWQR